MRGSDGVWRTWLGWQGKPNPNLVCTWSGRPGFDWFRSTLIPYFLVEGGFCQAVPVVRVNKSIHYILHLFSNHQDSLCIMSRKITKKLSQNPAIAKIPTNLMNNRRITTWPIDLLDSWARKKKIGCLGEKKKKKKKKSHLLPSHQATPPIPSFFFSLFSPTSYAYPHILKKFPIHSRHCFWLFSNKNTIFLQVQVHTSKTIRSSRRERERESSSTRSSFLRCCCFGTTHTHSSNLNYPARIPQHSTTTFAIFTYTPFQSKVKFHISLSPTRPESSKGLAVHEDGPTEGVLEEGGCFWKLDRAKRGRGRERTRRWRRGSQRDGPDSYLLDIIMFSWYLSQWQSYYFVSSKKVLPFCISQQEFGMLTNTFGITALLLAGCSSASPGIPNIYLISLYYHKYSPTFAPAQIDPGVTTAIVNIVGSADLNVRVGYFGVCIQPDGGAYMCNQNVSALADLVSVDQDPMNLIWVAQTFKDAIVFPYLM